MKTNIGNIDRIIRIILAIVIFALAWKYQSWWGLLGLIPLITAIIGYCPLYALLGMSTYKRRLFHFHR